MQPAFAVLAVFLACAWSCTPSDSPPKPATSTPTTTASEPAQATATIATADAATATANAAPTPAPATKAGQDFASQARLLYDLTACGGGQAPDVVGKKYFDHHCKDLERAVDRYKRRWLDIAGPELAKLVPANAPTRVVYPFGGGDLLTALATFPSASEITTLSLELAGDVTVLERLGKDEISTVLDTTRRYARFLLQVFHSKTSNMREIMRSDLPAQLIFGMLALRVHDLEPIALRYFRLASDGSVEYYDQAQLDAARAAAKGKKGEVAQTFANAEVEFRKKGESGPTRIWRHFGANLDDKHLAANPALLKHLEAKGSVSAMTKAASYLLWWDSFSAIRGYLLGHAAWMISDSTGPLPEDAAAAGFTQETYGTFERPFLDGAGAKGTRQFVKLWQSQPKRKLKFRYGYPDGSPSGHHHLVVTRKRD